MDLTTSICGVRLDNPVIPASGCCGYGKELAGLYDINVLGALSFKGTTKNARFGNECPRIAEAPSGMLNAVGLQNPGIDAVLNKELPELLAIFKKPVIANIGGFSEEEYIYCCEKADKSDGIAIIELNISCPNVHNGGMSFGTSADCAYSLISKIKKTVKKPLLAKLTPNVTDITEIALAAEAAGADGVTVINTLLGMRIDIGKRRPVLANTTGGFSGPAIFPVALAAVYRVASRVKIPVVGCGGVASAENVIEMLEAGACAVQIGAMNLKEPYICRDIIAALPEAMKKYGFKSVKEIIGCCK